jgi:hypothetical protein
MSFSFLASASSNYFSLLSGSDSCCLTEGFQLLEFLPKRNRPSTTRATGLFWRPPLRLPVSRPLPSLSPSSTGCPGTCTTSRG